MARQNYGLTAKGYELWRLQRQLRPIELDEKGFIERYLTAAPNPNFEQECLVCGERKHLIRSLVCLACVRNTLKEI